MGGGTFSILKGVSLRAAVEGTSEAGQRND
jgi:hypothetical protein